MGVLLLSPVVLSSCSAGQVTQTATQERDKTGAQAQVGDLSIRQGQLLSPRGGVYESGDDAELQLAIVNGGAEDDTLVSVDGEGFASAAIRSSGSASSSSATGSSSAGSSSAGATASATPTAGAAPTSSAGATSSSSGGASEQIDIPAGQSVYIGGDEYTITLTDLTDGLTPGQYLEVTLTFEKAGEVTIPVTVANPSSSVPRSSTFDFHQEEGGAEGSAGGSGSANG
jgi:copper(I)-binding protein